MSLTERTDQRPNWTFLTNHAHVLICLTLDPEIRMRDIAAKVGITERAVQRIIADLEGESVIERTKEGRKNRYTVDASRHLRHPIESHKTVSELLTLIMEK